MKKTLIVLAVILAFSTVAFAGPKSYQVTGPVIAITNDVITVQKGDEKWEIAYDKAKMPAVKVGDKVMIKYEMKANSIEVKAQAMPEKKAEPQPEPKKKESKK